MLIGVKGRILIERNNNMRWSPILHGIAATSGILGLLALVVFWIAAAKEGVSMFSMEHAYDDAVALFLASIAFGIGTLIHQKQEQK